MGGFRHVGCICFGIWGLAVFGFGFGRNLGGCGLVMWLGKEGGRERESWSSNGGRCSSRGLFYASHRLRPGWATCLPNCQNTWRRTTFDHLHSSSGKYPRNITPLSPEDQKHNTSSDTSEQHLDAHTTSAKESFRYRELGVQTPPFQPHPRSSKINGSKISTHPRNSA